MNFESNIIKSDAQDVEDDRSVETTGWAEDAKIGAYEQSYNGGKRVHYKPERTFMQSNIALFRAIGIK
ncbi:hypothetical protein P0O24_04050 [Methanotrichaceae archaeon M04Ac]|uniref:Uncharacterized protein n=1 Tax=Candidatus Methanocrinis alkalitolerans TaxID=3033395 RepID=A0ABT5XDI5_9EURY|nr:hypothetical protein [Candidatus Methanocrinis alkalitolerans]MCR3884808.1 hypothetical protein [Methanothrix sp.]MDF0592751.1 hypothetical protein [Candidatus Methanocrinis alkalitolerans]